MAIKPIAHWTPSAIIQGLMALGSLAAIIYMAVTGQQVPDVLVALVMAISGFYFGRESAQPLRSQPE